ncbi:hypothetical protein C8Q73DRAFT_263244 [Cubamyces lactineus]|nr:hypothetical protein C8Q73DRAFT_263244 [Cubamyces lactineus]
MPTISTLTSGARQLLRHLLIGTDAPGSRRTTLMPSSWAIAWMTSPRCVTRTATGRTSRLSLSLPITATGSSISTTCSSTSVSSSRRKQARVRCLKHTCPIRTTRSPCTVHIRRTRAQAAPLLLPRRAAARPRIRTKPWELSSRKFSATDSLPHLTCPGTLRLRFQHLLSTHPRPCLRASFPRRHSLGTPLKIHIWQDAHDIPEPVPFGGPFTAVELSANMSTFKATTQEALRAGTVCASTPMQGWTEDGPTSHSRSSQPRRCGTQRCPVRLRTPHR